MLQVCEALAEAHGLGIVHRDIEPSNLFLTTGVDGLPCLEVLDFGISKATNAIDATRPDFGLTQTQTVMGSPQYMAPEQMRSSRRVDGRTDVWGLGSRDESSPRRRAIRLDCLMVTTSARRSSQ